MKKIGYTLAEILITLGIVSVIAALTLPNIINVNKQTYFGTRERVVTLIQQGLTNLMSSADNESQSRAEKLSILTYNDLGLNNPNPNGYIMQNNAQFFDRVQSFVKLTPAAMTNAEKTAYLNSAYVMNGNNRVLLRDRYRNFRNSEIYQLPKMQALIIVEPIISEFSNNNLETIHSVVARIFVDADGTKGQNKLNNNDDGDIDVYGLGNDGTIYRNNSQECIDFNSGCKIP